MELETFILYLNQCIETTAVIKSYFWCWRRLLKRTRDVRNCYNTLLMEFGTSIRILAVVLGLAVWVVWVVWGGRLSWLVSLVGWVGLFGLVELVSRVCWVGPDWLCWSVWWIG